MLSKLQNPKSCEMHLLLEALEEIEEILVKSDFLK